MPLHLRAIVNEYGECSAALLGPRCRPLTFGDGEQRMLFYVYLERKAFSGLLPHDFTCLVCSNKFGVRGIAVNIVRFSVVGADR